MTPTQEQILWTLSGRNQLSDDDLIKAWRYWSSSSITADELLCAREALTTAGYLESFGSLWKLTYKGEAKLRKLQNER